MSAAAEQLRVSYWRSGSLFEQIAEDLFLRMAHDAEYTGMHRHTLRLVAANVRNDPVPPHYEVRFRASSASETVAVAESAAGLALVERLDDRLRITAAGGSVTSAKSMVKEIALRFPDKRDPLSTVVRAWRYGDRGTRSFAHTVHTSHWSAIQANYAPHTRSALEALVRTREPTEGGRLIFWHGAPGTGKTRALAALVHEWRDWCDVHLLTDPDRFFERPDYILSILGTHSSDPAKTDRWKLIVAEDADEYLRAEARQTSQGALGRLLNLTDGLLGQGSNMLVLLTTNEDLGLVDPALVRPGRCLATVEFRRFTRAEASQWLPPGARGPSGEVTLAELYANGGEYL